MKGFISAKNLHRQLLTDLMQQVSQHTKNIKNSSLGQWTEHYPNQPKAW